MRLTLNERTSRLYVVETDDDQYIGCLALHADGSSILIYPNTVGRPAHVAIEDIVILVAASHHPMVVES